MPARPQRSRAFNISLLIFLHLLIVLPLAYSLNIWGDEASTLHTTQQWLVSALENAAADERQAPLYFWLMSLWRYLNGSIFFARLFSIICVVAAIRLFADLARTLFEPRAALLVTAFFAMHPFLVWASLEIRVYSLVLLLSTIVLRLFFECFDTGIEVDRHRPQRTGNILFVLTAVIALYTNYYLGFLLAGCFVGLLAIGRWAEVRRYLLLMAAAAVAFLPMALVVRAQMAANTNGFYEQRSLVTGLKYLWHHLLTFMLPSEVFPGEDISWADIVRVWAVRAILVVLAFFAIRNRQLISRRTVVLGSITATIGAWLFVAYLLLGPLYVEVRHASVLFVPLILAAASLISDVVGTSLERTAGKLAVAAGGLLVLASFSYGLLTLYPRGAKRGDWARVGEYIKQNETAGQPIVIFHTFDAMALPYHYSGVNQILPDERFFEFEVEAAFGTADSLRRQTDFTISEIPPGADEIWLVTTDKCRITEACVPLENFVAANYTVIREQQFYLEKVRLLKKKTQ